MWHYRRAKASILEQSKFQSATTRNVLEFYQKQGEFHFAAVKALDAVVAGTVEQDCVDNPL